MKRDGFDVLSDDIQIGVDGHRTSLHSSAQRVRRADRDMPGLDRRRLRICMLLAIQTSSVPGNSVARCVDPASGEVEILAQAEFAARSNSALLIPKIGETLAACGAEVRDLEAIVVVRGPGSFTGIRVGLSAAKGLAEVSGSKIIALSQLALLASSSGHKHVLAAIDAGRGEYYAGEYLEGRARIEAPSDCIGALCCGAEGACCPGLPGSLPEWLRVQRPDWKWPSVRSGSHCRTRRRGCSSPCFGALLRGGLRRRGNPGCQLPAPLRRRRDLRTEECFETVVDPEWLHIATLSTP